MLDMLRQAWLWQALRSAKGRLLTVFLGRRPGDVPVDRPLVSVVLPVYNQADLLRDAAHSVLAQTYSNFELILVNDGSTDGVEAVLEEFLGHPRVRVLTQANQKLPKALSNGFEFARGTYWTWTSADNLMQPEHLERLVAFLESHPETAMVYADYRVIDDRGLPLRDPAFRPQNRRSPDDPDIHLPRSAAPINTVQDNFIGPCFLYRAAAGRLLGDYDPTPCVEDYDYWMRMNTAFRIDHLGTDEVLYQYRWHDNSLSSQNRGRRMYELTQRLMAHDGERRAFYEQSWAVHADAATLAWLRNVPTGPHRLHAWQPGTPPRLVPGKNLLLVHADSLPGLPGRPPQTCVAAWLDGGQPDPYAQALSMQQRADVCFAPDAACAARLELFLRAVFRAVPGAALLEWALKFGDNQLFYEVNRPPDVRRRPLPAPYLPPGRRLRVLLQADAPTSAMLDKLRERAEHLREEGCDVCVLLLGGGSVPQGWDMDCFPAHLLPRRQAAYRELLRTGRIDLVQAYDSRFGAAAAAGLGVRFVQTLVGTPAGRRRSYREADAWTTAYICLSVEAARAADLDLGLPLEKVIAAPNVGGSAGVLAWLVQGGHPSAARAWLRPLAEAATEHDTHSRGQAA